LDSALAGFDDSAEIALPGTLPWGGTYKGANGYKEMVGKLRSLLDEFRPSPQAFIEDGDQVVVPIDVQGRITAGHEFGWRAIWLYRISDGKIVRGELFVDTAQAIADTVATTGQ